MRHVPDVHGTRFTRRLFHPLRQRLTVIVRQHLQQFGLLQYFGNSFRQRRRNLFRIAAFRIVAIISAKLFASEEKIKAVVETLALIRRLRQRDAQCILQQNAISITNAVDRPVRIDRLGRRDRNVRSTQRAKEIFERFLHGRAA